MTNWANILSKLCINFTMDIKNRYGFRNAANQYLVSTSFLRQLYRGSGLDCGFGDPGSIPGITSLPVDPPMVRRLKTSFNVPGLCRGRLGT